MLRGDVQQNCTSHATPFLSRATAFLVVALVVTTAAVSPRLIQAQSNSASLASSRLPFDRLAQYSDLAVEWLQEYLRIDTTNPPGNELQAANFFKKMLDNEGIENQVFEYQPGRADLWARMPHTSFDAKPPIILLNHMDVVTSDPAH